MARIDPFTIGLNRQAEDMLKSETVTDMEPGLNKDIVQALIGAYRQVEKKDLTQGGERLNRFQASAMRVEAALRDGGATTEDLQVLNEAKQVFSGLLKEFKLKEYLDAAFEEDRAKKEIEDSERRSRLSQSLGDFLR